MRDNLTEYGWLPLRRSDGPIAGWHLCSAVAQGEIERLPRDVERPSLAGDFACFCQRLFERNSLHFACFQIGIRRPISACQALSTDGSTSPYLARKILSTRSA